MIRTLIGVFVAVIVPSNLCFSQQQSSFDTVKAKAVEALAGFAELDQLGFTGKIEDASGSGSTSMLNSGNRQTIVMSGGGGNRNSFSGNFELLCTSDDELVLRSTGKSLPQIKTYDDGERLLSEMTVEGEPVSTTQAISELSQLLNWKKLARMLENSESAKMSNTDNNLLFKLPLSKRMIRSASGMAAIGKPEILEINTEIEMTPEFELVSVQFSVVRSNPMAAIMNMQGGGGRSSIRIGNPRGAGANTDKENEELLKTIKESAGSSEVGKTTIYRLLCSEPTNEIINFAQKMRTMTMQKNNL